MLHHVEIYVSDLSRSRQFWSNLLGQIGYEEADFWGEGFTLRPHSGQENEAYLTFVQVRARHADHSYHRCGVGLNHLAFRVEKRETVDSLRRYCLQAGITCLYDEKFPFANGGDEYYAVFLEDPDRIKVEFVAE